MALMSYTTLVADKNTTGSIASWVNYSKLQPTVILEEAQDLLYSLLRVREMRTQARFTMALYGDRTPLPARFLDPIGTLLLNSINTRVDQKDQDTVTNCRTYQETSGTLGSNPFTTTNGSNTVSVALTNHGFTQGSVFYSSGATLFNGATINGTFLVNGITDANNFTIDITSLGTTPNASSSGGGSAVAYTIDILNPGIPVWFGIWDENIIFDVAFNQQCLCTLNYYQSLALLSSTNTQNFLCTRYPMLLRQACIASAAGFMKDREAQTAETQILTAMVQRVNVENDMSMRGMDLSPIIP